MKRRLQAKLDNMSEIRFRHRFVPVTSVLTPLDEDCVQIGQIVNTNPRFDSFYELRQKSIVATSEDVKDDDSVGDLSESNRTASKESKAKSKAPYFEPMIYDDDRDRERDRRANRAGLNCSTQ